MKRILSVFGTRPEAIKMAPVVLSLKNDPSFDSRVCVTAQHREMLDSVLNTFAITPEFDLSIMKSGQTLSYITQAVINGVDKVTDDFRPDVLLVHGDTTTAFAAALVGFYKGIKVCHIEAGLRSGDILSPFPEEFNRRAVASLSSFHFAPTDRAVCNLLSEGVAKERISLVGNTVIDALLMSLRRPSAMTLPASPFLLMTVHRREHADEDVISIFKGIRKVLDEYPSVKLIYPVHKNPRFYDIARKMFDNAENIYLCEPLEVSDFHHLLSKCRFVITDSGGIQEEAAFLGKPVLVVRKNTERQEAAAYGTLRLVGTSSDTIYAECKRLLNDDTAYAKASIPCDLYGDGSAAARIVDILRTM